jgi:hypothetical protein
MLPNPELSALERSRREPRSRFTPKPTAGLRIEERSEQIQALYFSSLVRCNARLRQLFDHKFVARFYPPTAPFGAQAVYSVGRAALPLVARRLEMELPEVTRLARCSHTPTFIEHTLAVADIYIEFQRAVARRDCVHIERWLSEFQCRHEWDIRPTAGGKWRKEAFKPDGFVRLEYGGNYHNFFIEADLGHTSSKQFLGKLLTHQRYLESGLFEQTYGGTQFVTLVVTIGERRARNLQGIVGEKDGALFWFTTFERMKRTGILEPIWRLPYSDEGYRLIG